MRWDENGCDTYEGDQCKDGLVTGYWHDKGMQQQYDKFKQKQQGKYPKKFDPLWIDPAAPENNNTCNKQGNKKRNRDKLEIMGSFFFFSRLCRRNFLLSYLFIELEILDLPYFFFTQYFIPGWSGKFIIKQRTVQNAFLFEILLK